MLITSSYTRDSSGCKIAVRHKATSAVISFLPFFGTSARKRCPNFLTYLPRVCLTCAANSFLIYDLLRCPQPLSDLVEQERKLTSLLQSHFTFCRPVYYYWATNGKMERLTEKSTPVAGCGSANQGLRKRESSRPDVTASSYYPTTAAA